MLWYKSWLDTRSRFLIGLAVVLVSACGIVIDWAQLREVLPNLASSVGNDASSFGRALSDAFETQQTYRGFIWSQWFRQNFTFIATLLAALLGSGSPFSASGRGLLFSLALPATRERWLGTRAATGLALLLALALTGALAIAALSPFIGEHYGVIDALVHGVSVFAASSVFFGISLLLTTAFNDVWRPLLLGCLAAVVIGLVEMVLPRSFGLFAVMSARTYFENGSLPWVGPIASASLTAALTYAAVANAARRDY